MVYCGVIIMLSDSKVPLALSWRRCKLLKALPMWRFEAYPHIIVVRPFQRTHEVVVLVGDISLIVVLSDKDDNVLFRIYTCSSLLLLVPLMVFC